MFYTLRFVVLCTNSDGTNPPVFITQMGECVFLDLAITESHVLWLDVSHMTYLCLLMNYFDFNFNFN